MAPAVRLPLHARRRPTRPGTAATSTCRPLHPAVPDSRQRGDGTGLRSPVRLGWSCAGLPMGPPWAPATWRGGRWPTRAGRRRGATGAPPAPSGPPGAREARVSEIDCCIVGGGPAGMMLGLLLARQGVQVTVLEKHGDFLRDFRGDTVHPMTLDVLDELGLIDEFDALVRGRMEAVEFATTDGVLVHQDL